MLKDESYIINSLASESDKQGFKPIESEKIILYEDISRWSQDMNEKNILVFKRRSRSNIRPSIHKKIIPTQCPLNYPLISIKKTNKSQNIHTRKLSKNIQSSQVDSDHLKSIFISEKMKRSIYNPPAFRIQINQKNKEKVLNN
ncbi:hypothetical protein SteCoe_6128 [Stentor coeruleus]|uniref:Uncharacterized protein n=1 Tax=Stentor coeruleus TaxID=5963 RepID=A0A1R2CQS8_9CILI|nr:hypothetical protein SteCoe_6128 [Stentor coeruleus]